MSGGGELRAFFEAGQEDMAQVVENAGGKYSQLIGDAAENVRASVDEVKNADTGTAGAINGIHGDPYAGPAGSGPLADGGTASGGSGWHEGDPIPPPGEGSADGIAAGGSGNYVPVSAENGSPRLFKRLFPELTEVNAPRLGQGPEWQRNCQSCVNAVDHTLDGQPASAVPRPPQGFRWPDSVTKTIGGGKPFVRVGGYDDITDQVTKAGDGARGVVWGRRFRQIGSRSIEVEGHVFNVVNRGGRVFYVDGQTGAFARLENFSILNLLRTN